MLRAMAWARRHWRVQRSVRQAIAAALAAAPLGCSSLDCSTDAKDFSVDEAVTAEAMDFAMGAHPAANTWQDVQCEEVCKQVSFRSQVIMDTCALTLPDPATHVGAKPGHITCTGKGVVICEGRRPLGHREVPLPVGDGHCNGATIAATIAAMAHLERASVVAFEQLATQLDQLGAPEDLAQRCLAAAADERRHDWALTAIAEELGAIVPAAEQTELPDDLFTIALHNAVEGCVHESWAAVLAQHRADSSDNPRLAETFSTIARDEARHGQLAWDLHAFFMTRLSEQEQVTVQRAQQDALAALPKLAVEQAQWFAERAPTLGLHPTAAAQASRRFAQSLS